jgi:hypothetical protein
MTNRPCKNLVSRLKQVDLLTMAADFFGGISGIKDGFGIVDDPLVIVISVIC